MLPKAPDPKDEQFTRAHPFTTDVQVRHDGKSSYAGRATFDSHSQYPSFALFLDNKNALILEQVPEKTKTFKRVGTATFWFGVPVARSTATPELPMGAMQQLLISQGEPSNTQHAECPAKTGARKKSWMSGKVSSMLRKRSKFTQDPKEGQGGSEAPDKGLWKANGSIQVVVII